MGTMLDFTVYTALLLFGVIGLPALQTFWESQPWHVAVLVSAIYISCLLVGSLGVLLILLREYYLGRLEQVKRRGVRG